VANQFAPEYSILIDNAPGGGTPADAGNYAALPGGVGIDQILDAHYVLATGWDARHRHNYIGPGAPDLTSLGSLGGQFNSSENAGGGAGSMLEWSIPVADLGSQPFTVYGATMDIGAPATFDYTGPLHTPEPSTFAMMGIMGLSAVAFLRRRCIAR
jgi:hypothetical protein